MSDSFNTLEDFEGKEIFTFIKNGEIVESKKHG